MNLRIADSAGLVAFLHRVISTSGETLLSTGELEIVDLEGVLFYHGNEPVTVGGPFPSVEALVRSEGVRRHPDAARSTADEFSHEIFEWAGSFFRIERDADGHVSQHGDFPGAMDG